MARKQKDLMDDNGWYTMMAKPMKTLELHYPTIQFLIKADKPRMMLEEHETNL